MQAHGRLSVARVLHAVKPQRVCKEDFYKAWNKNSVSIPRSFSYLKPRVEEHVK